MSNSLPIEWRPRCVARAAAAPHPTIVALRVTGRGATDPLSAFKPERRRIRGSFIALSLAGLAYIQIVGGLVYVRPVDSPQPSPVPSTRVVTLVNSRPSAAEVVIDGSHRGVTPLELSLPIGLHTLELRTGSAERILPVTVQAGVMLSVDVDFAVDPPASVDPLGVGLNAGASPVSVSELRRDLRFENLLQ